MADLGDKTSLSQRLASDPKKSAWVSANAGSGKTHVLVNRIIRLMLDGANPGKILALTFTKAAAAEMANRLNQRLAGWAMLGHDELAGDIAGITGTAPSPDQLLRARRLFAHALETPGGLKIQTIHAFCERILHRFALEANVAPEFEILDDRTGSELLNEARDRVFENPDEAAIKDLKVVSSALSAAGFDGLIAQVLKRRTLLRAFHRTHGGLDEMIIRLRNVFKLKPEETKDTLMEKAIGGTLPEVIPALIEFYSAGTKTDIEKSDTLIAMARSDSPEDRLNLYKSLFFTKAGDRRKKLATKKISDENSDIARHLEEEAERIGKLVEKLASVRIADFTGSLLNLADKILENYEVAKNDRALLDYDDLIRHTADLLSQTQAAAWVLYKLDSGIDHILVDEAQDTNLDQWQVVSALSNEFFAGVGIGNPVRTVFAVGDEKQSIFSFQGASPEEFDRMRRHFQRRAGFVDHDFEKVELTVSFRSTAQVLEAVDLTFAQETAAQGMTSFGAAPVHEAYRHGHAGLVEIWPPEMPGDEDEKDPWDAPLDYVSTASPRVKLAHRIAASIKGWIDKETLTPRGRTVRAGDILILVRRRNNFVDAMVEALKERDVPVAGIDRMRLSQQLAIMDLLALARFVLLPQDDLNLAVVLKGPLFGLGEDDLFELAHNRKSTLWRALATSGLTEIHDQLTALLLRADRVPPYEFFARILNADNGRQKFIKRLGLEANDPIDEFLSLSLEYEKTSTPSLQGFVAWFGASDVDAKRDMEHGRNEVRIMTVHGAKGLEANIVILPDTCHQVPDNTKQANILTKEFEEQGGKTHDLLIWRPNKSFENNTVKQCLEDKQQAEMAEYNRLLYVAMTRARDRLYIAGYEGKRASSPSSWYHLVSQALKPHSDEVLDAQGNITCWRLSGEQTVEPLDKHENDDLASSAQTPPPWAHQPVKSEPQQIGLISPSRLGGADELTGAEPSPAPATLRPSPLQTPPQEPYLRGRLIHKLLEYAPGANRETYSDFCQQFLARSAPALSEPDRNRIADDVLRVLATEEFSNLFDVHGLSEVPIVGQVQLIGHTKAVKVSGRIDRLIVRDNQVFVIDFKTDRIVANSPEAISGDYLRQMAVYRHLLSKIFPDRQITCHLLWTTGPQLMELPQALLSGVLQGWVE